MTIIYRISDAGYKKVKPIYINNKTCLENAVKVFHKHKFIIIADNCSNDTMEMIKCIKNDADIIETSIGHGAGTFNIALDYAVNLPDSEIVYFLENDYLHRYNSDKILEEGILIGADFVSLYDHIDKYIAPEHGGNKFCQGGSELTRVYITKSSHWKLTNSTTMTFAATVKTLKELKNLMLKHTQTSHPNDFEMFIELINSGRTLITPIPSYSTHGETQWLAPLINWEEISKL